MLEVPLTPVKFFHLQMPEARKYFVAFWRFRVHPVFPAYVAAA